MINLGLAIDVAIKKIGEALHVVDEVQPYSAWFRTFGSIAIVAGLTYLVFALAN